MEFKLSNNYLNSYIFTFNLIWSNLREGGVLNNSASQAELPCSNVYKENIHL